MELPVSEQVLELNITHLGRLASGLVKMFDLQLYTDVKFLVSGQPIGAHRAILASQSDYFDCLLYGPMMEGRASDITLKETPLEAFRELLRFVYSGSVAAVNLTTTLDLHILADRYGFPYLKEGIEAHLAGIISSENVLLFHSHAQASSAPLFQDKCEVFMDLHAAEVIASQVLQRLPKENLKKLIARDSFVVVSSKYKSVQRNKTNQLSKNEKTYSIKSRCTHTLQQLRRALLPHVVHLHPLSHGLENLYLITIYYYFIHERLVPSHLLWG